MNVLQRFSAASSRPISGIITRGLRWDVPINWTRPTKIPCTKPEKSGDLASLPKIDPKKFIPSYEKELDGVDERLKKLFTLENNPRRETIRTYVYGMVQNVHRHEQDYRSSEATLAFLTARIRAMQDQQLTQPRNKVLNRRLKETIDRRRRLLRILRKHDYKRFEWLLEKLNLVYKPVPEVIERIERKASIRKMTALHCDGIKQDRLDAYRQELESQQMDFLERKMKNLEFIRNEQIACKVKVTVTEEEIKQAKEQYAAALEKKRKQQEEEEIRRAEI